MNNFGRFSCENQIYYIRVVEAPTPTEICLYCALIDCFAEFHYFLTTSSVSLRSTPSPTGEGL